MKNPRPGGLPKERNLTVAKQGSEKTAKSSLRAPMREEEGQSRALGGFVRKVRKSHGEKNCLRKGLKQSNRRVCDDGLRGFLEIGKRGDQGSCFNYSFRRYEEAVGCYFNKGISKPPHTGGVKKKEKRGRRRNH